MGRFSVFNGLIAGILIFLIQVLILKDVVLYQYAFCFSYVIIFLLIPIEASAVLQLFIGFIIGLGVDVFYNTLGIHAAASTFFIFIKIFWIKVLTPSGGYDSGARISVRTQGLEWFSTYAYPLILIHSMLLFFIEAAGHLFWQTLAKGFYSSLFTMAMVLIFQYLFFKKLKKHE